MRIDGFQNIPPILQSFKTDKLQKPTSETEGASSSVSLSSFPEVLQTVQRQSAQSATARGARVDELAHEVQSGKFSVDAKELASKLVDLQIIDTQGLK